VGKRRARIGVITCDEDATARMIKVGEHPIAQGPDLGIRQPRFWMATFPMNRKEPHLVVLRE
jgi:hypothetical protein